MQSKIALVVLVLFAISGTCWSQSETGWVGNWLGMVTRIQADQPHWITPLATVTPRLEQELRFDAVRQAGNGTTLWNIDGGKGLEIIPESHVELLFNLPPYLIHSNANGNDGSGDVSFVMKYRIAASNESHRNYVLTVFLGGTIPTGSYRNGSVAAAITPTIAAGKGWGKFDVQSTIGLGIPVSHENTIGHALSWNSAFQYHAARFLWPEVEVNTTFFNGGTNSGHKQVFLTPGFVVGRLPIHNRIGITAGIGMQIAATRFHTFTHALVLSARMPF